MCLFCTRHFTKWTSHHWLSQLKGVCFHLLLLLTEVDDSWREAARGGASSLCVFIGQYIAGKAMSLLAKHRAGVGSYVSSLVF